MSKLGRSFGLGLALGALTGYYLSTEKGQTLVSRLKKELEKANQEPEHYQFLLKSHALGKLSEWSNVFTANEAEEAIGAEVDDIIISYAEDVG